VQYPLPYLASLPYSDQAEARRQRVKDARRRKEERLKAKREELLKQFAKEDEAGKK
jgi:large subunit ribosomal protein L19e